MPLFTEALELLQQLIATPRTSRDEAAAAAILRRHLTRSGIPYQAEANNTWCIAPGYDPARPTLLICAHIDTVRPADSWTRDPFLPTLEGDRLYGLGANDDGASLVCLLQAFRHLADRAQPYNLVFLASAEEEVSGADGISRVLPLLPAIDVALVGEPTGMQPAVAEKGLMVLDVTEEGKAGHAARDEGVNALYLALDDLQRLRQHRFPHVSPLLGAVKATATVIKAGTQHNVVPDRCTFTIDVRSNECYTNRQLYEHFCQLMHGRVEARSFRLNSSRIDPGHPLVRRALALPPTPEGLPRQPFGSPTLSDQALLACPSLKMGPGDSRRSHTADEYICLAELRHAIDDYITLLDGLQLTK